MSKKSKKTAQNPALDLFGQVPVSIPEVRLWCLVVAHLPADSPRLAHYVLAWHVIDKIAAAKLAGTFEADMKKADESAPVDLLSVFTSGV